MLLHEARDELLKEIDAQIREREVSFAGSPAADFALYRERVGEVNALKTAQEVVRTVFADLFNEEEDD